MRYVDGHPPGTIAIVSADLSRYPDFHISMLRTKVPTGSTVDWGRGAGIAGNLNAITRRALERGHHWVWYMGDDHVWDPDLLIHLLSRDVGVVAHICAHRLPPYMPHIYKAVPNDTLFEVAIASSVAHDVHNLIAAGKSDHEILKAIGLVIQMQGGMAAVAGDTEVSLPLDCGGLMSSLPYADVAGQLQELQSFTRSMGGIDEPFMYLSFLSLTVIPALRITDRGLFDAAEFQDVPLFVA